MYKTIYLNISFFLIDPLLNEIHECLPTDLIKHYLYLPNETPLPLTYVCA